MAKPETITSAANPLVKDVRRAIARGAVTGQGWCVAETFHLLEEALASGCDVKTVLVAESAQAAVEECLANPPRAIPERAMPADHAILENAIPENAVPPDGATAARPIPLPPRVVVLPDALFQDLSGIETSQGVMVLVKAPVWKLEQLFCGCPLVVVLDGVQDPGNAGAIIRAAEAFGASGVLFLKGAVSPHNPKTLRAAAGSLFRIPYLHGLDAPMARAALQQSRLELYCGVPRHPGASARSLEAIDFTAPCGLIIGNEAHGVSQELRAVALDISIPTMGVESLNAAVAAGILLYEARRQRTVNREPV